MKKITWPKGGVPVRQLKAMEWAEQYDFFVYVLQRLSSEEIKFHGMSDLIKPFSVQRYRRARQQAELYIGILIEGINSQMLYNHREQLLKEKLSKNHYFGNKELFRQLKRNMDREDWPAEVVAAYEELKAKIVKETDTGTET